MTPGLPPLFTPENHPKVKFRPAFDSSTTSLGYLWRRIWGSEQSRYYNSYGYSAYPETRTEELNDVLHWLRTSASASTPVLSMHGPSGVGKSVIAHAIYQACVRKELLSSFFFSSSHPTTSTPKHFVRVVLYDLVEARPDLRRPVSEILDSHPAIWDASLEEQFKTLIVGAFRSKGFMQRLRMRQRRKLHLILIYGLDEMDEAQSVFDMILSNLNDGHLPMRFIVFNQTESNIAKLVDTHPFRHLIFPIAIHPKNTTRDIRTYLRGSFAEIRSGRTNGAELFPDVWPSHEEFEVVVQNAQAQFIYASLFIEAVKDKIGVILYHPVLLVPDILEHTRETSPHLGALDRLFRYILLKAGESCRNQGELMAILRSLLVFRFTFGAASPLFLELFWNFSSDLSRNPAYFRTQIGAACYLLIYNGANDTDIHFRHSSVMNFFRDPDHSGPYYLDELKSYHAIVGEWLQRLVHWNTSAKGSGFDRPAVKTLWEQWGTFITHSRAPDEIVISHLLAFDLSKLFNHALTLLLGGSRPFLSLFRNLKMLADWLQNCELPHAARLHRRFMLATQTIHIKPTVPPQVKTDLLTWIILDLSSCKYACATTKRVQDSVKSAASAINFIAVGEDASTDINLLDLHIQDGYAATLDQLVKEMSDVNPRDHDTANRERCRALAFNVLGSGLLSLCGPNRDLLPHCRQTIQFSMRIRGRFEFDRSGSVAEEYVECRMTMLRWLKSFDSDKDSQIRDLVRQLNGFVPEESWWHKLLSLLWPW